LSTSTFTVSGMTCSHCVSSVTEEVHALPEVSEVDVDLATGRVTVVSTASITDDRVRAAVEEAGYQLVGRVE
jgi:copper chaperone